jgi:dTDP-glucose 4,6-dehydratase
MSKHIIFGGNGFLGTELAKKLSARGENVLICDVNKTSAAGIYDLRGVSSLKINVTDVQSFSQITTEPGDIVYHFSAKLLVPILPRKGRQDYFWNALFVGTVNILNFMEEQGLKQLVYFTTDRVSGKTQQHPRSESHPRIPLGPYGEANYQELLCETYREKGFPNEEFNLGSAEPPIVNELLKSLIKHVNSKSILIPTPAFAVKLTLEFLDRINKPLMDPEQFIIADETCALDYSKG